MVQETQTPVGTKKDRNPGLLWVLGWTLLVTAAFPVALIGMPPVAAVGIWLSNQGMYAGFWVTPPSSVLEGSGMLLCLALALAFFQWLICQRQLEMDMATIRNAHKDG